MKVILLALFVTTCLAASATPFPNPIYGGETFSLIVNLANAEDISVALSLEGTSCGDISSNESVICTKQEGSDIYKCDRYQVSAGSYSACVCYYSSGSTACANFESFPSDTKITVNGPKDLSADVVAAAGVLFQLQVDGLALESFQAILTTDACDGDGKTVVQSLNTPDQIHADHILFEAVQIGSASDLNVCVCYDCFRNPFDTTCCTDNSKFSHPIGQILVQGPYFREVSHAVAESFTLTVTGKNIVQDDKISVILATDGCGSDDVQTAVQQDLAHLALRTAYEISTDENNIVTATYPGITLLTNANYTICMCPSSTYTCTVFQHFVARAASIVSIGPDVGQLDMDVIAGRHFDLALTGNGLSTKDRIRIVSEDVECGSDESAYHTIALSKFLCDESGECDDLDLTVQASSVSLLSSEETWHNVALQSTGRFRVCWCHNYCQYGEDFGIDVGFLNVEGLGTNRRFACGAYLPCSVEIRGPNSMPVSENDRAYFLELTDSVGQYQPCHVQHQNETLSPSIMVRRNGVDVKVYNNGTHSYVLFDIDKTSAPGVMQICYCQKYFDVDWKCDAYNDYNQIVGYVDVLPYPDSMALTSTTNAICYPGALCQVSLSSNNFHWRDRLMLTTEETCGDTGIPGGLLFQNDQFGEILAGGGGASIYRSLSSPYDKFTLGLPSQLLENGMLMCFCSAALTPDGSCERVEEFYQEAGRLYIFGAKRLEDSITCAHGDGSCNFELPIVGPIGNHKIMLIDAEETCGDGQKAGLFKRNPITGALVQESDPVIYSYTFNEARVPGMYRICFCLDAYGNVCNEHTHFLYFVGMFEVQEGLTAVTNSNLPASPFTISVDIDLAVEGQVVCAVFNRPWNATSHPPEMSDLTDCRIEDACVGVRNHIFTLPGDHTFHIGLIDFARIREIGLYRSVHVWCAHDGICDDGFCVMPPNKDGIVVEINDWPHFLEWELPSGSVHNLTYQNSLGLIEQAVLLKVVNKKDGDYCRSRATAGEVCGFYDGCSGFYNAQEDTITWTMHKSPQPGMYRVCLCDRFWQEPGLRSECANWVSMGSVVTVGPTVTDDTLLLNIGEGITFNIVGANLTKEDKMIGVRGGCLQSRRLQENVTDTNVTNLTDVHEGEEEDVLLEVKLVNHNFGDVEQLWEVQSAKHTSGVYSICWCSSLSACSSVSDYNLEVLKIEVPQRSDCQIGPWGEYGSCDRTCGGGRAFSYRYILQQPLGGGAACPVSDELVRLQACNELPCELLSADEMIFHPPFPVAKEPFRVVIYGSNFDETEDRIALYDVSFLEEGEFSCANTVNYVAAGGASCIHKGSHSDMLICGDGVNSIRLQQGGMFVACICDGSEQKKNVSDGTNVPLVVGCEEIGGFTNSIADGGFINVTRIVPLTNKPAPETTHELETLDLVLYSMLALVVVGLGMGLGLVMRARRRDREHKRQLEEQKKLVERELSKMSRNNTPKTKGMRSVSKHALSVLSGVKDRFEQAAKLELDISCTNSHAATPCGSVTPTGDGVKRLEFITTTLGKQPTLTPVLTPTGQYVPGNQLTSPTAKSAKSAKSNIDDLFLDTDDEEFVSSALTPKSAAIFALDSSSTSIKQQLYVEDNKYISDVCSVQASTRCTDRSLRAMPFVPKLQMEKVQNWGQYQEAKEKKQAEKLVAQQKIQEEYIKSISQQGERPATPNPLDCTLTPPVPLELPKPISISLPQEVDVKSTCSSPISPLLFKRGMASTKANSNLTLPIAKITDVPKINLPSTNNSTNAINSLGKVPNMPSQALTPLMGRIPLPPSLPSLKKSNLLDVPKPPATPDIGTPNATPPPTPPRIPVDGYNTRQPNITFNLNNDMAPATPPSTPSDIMPPPLPNHIPESPPGAPPRILVDLSGTHTEFISPAQPEVSFAESIPVRATEKEKSPSKSVKSVMSSARAFRSGNIFCIDGETEGEGTPVDSQTQLTPLGSERQSSDEMAAPLYLSNSVPLTIESVSKLDDDSPKAKKMKKKKSKKKKKIRAEDE
eukprot:gene442-894_t